jgi:hypothetical protein
LKTNVLLQSKLAIAPSRLAIKEDVEMRVVSSRPNVALIKALWGGGGGGGFAALPTEACIISSYNNVERASKSN